MQLVIQNSCLFPGSFDDLGLESILRRELSTRLHISMTQHMPEFLRTAISEIQTHAHKGSQLLELTCIAQKFVSAARSSDVKRLCLLDDAASPVCMLKVLGIVGNAL